MNRLKVSIYNLNCAGCVIHIERFMRQQEGVVWAVVNFAASEATVIYDPAAFRLSRFLQEVKQQGYQVGLRSEPARQLSTKGMGHQLYAKVQQWFGPLSDSFSPYRMSSREIRKTSQPDF